MEVVSVRTHGFVQLVDKPAEQDHYCVAFGWDESKNEDILRSTRVTFGRRFSQRTLSMQSDFAMLGSHEMVDDVRPRSRSSRVAEPFLADEALYDASGVVNSTVAVGNQQVVSRIS